jgi:glycosyltransferase involved in cell wall biosynthesis
MQAGFCLDCPGNFIQAGRVPGPTTCAVVIPCFNEGASIAALVAAARRQFPQVLVVDDGSTDNTAAQAQLAGAQVVTHTKNLGKGTALRTGLARAREQGFEWAFTLDGDGQHDPDDMPAFLECARQTGALLIAGNRMRNARAIPWLRRQVNRWMSRQLSRRAGRSLPDSQCGFRLIHLATWAVLPLQTEHFEVESETLMAFLAAARPVAFVPVRVIGRGRSSHIHPATDSLRWWRWWRGLDAPAARSAETVTAD